MKRIKTEYPGVFYREAGRIGGPGREKIFYIVFKKGGKLFEEKAGRQYADDMTASRAARIRSDRIEGRRESPKEKREAQRAIKDIWTIEKLWTDYKEKHPDLKSLKQDECRFSKHIQPSLGRKEPIELVPLDVDRIRLHLSKKMKPATVRNVMELLRRIIGYARKKQLCPTPGFKIEMPAVNNLRTEDLSDEQLQSLLRVLRERTVTQKDGSLQKLNADACDAMLLALLTGMRRMEILGLTWDAVDFRRGFITIRDPKGGTDQAIPLSETASELLKGRPHEHDALFVFPGRKSKKKGERHRADAARHFREIRDAAGLPETFRPMHGLRHTFASHLASSGEVDLYTIQKLLTHKSPLMTQRYAHLRDETLRRASTLAGNIIAQSAKAEDHKNETGTA
jgi:integrase